MSETVKIEKGILKFRPRARLLHILGYELITDEATALTELVKNSYDADAEEVQVILTDVLSKEKGSIEVRDDGHGMVLEKIRSAWMEPAKDNKVGKSGFVSRTVKFNRLPLGEKGVGRFSADKLGLKLEIITRSCDFDPKTKKVKNLSPVEVVVVIEGSKFLENDYLDQVECEYWTQAPSEFKGDDHGVLLRISQLREDWSKETIEKIRLSLARLSSPLESAKDFEVLLTCNDFPDLSSKIENPLLKIAPYTLDAKINENGLMIYTLNGKEEGQKDLRVGKKRFENSKNVYKRVPVCGPFEIKLFAYDRDRTKLKKYGMDQQKLNLLGLLCGVSIYRDNFRVLPYGEQGNDWLNFDRRRVQNPGEFLETTV